MKNNSQWISVADRLPRLESLEDVLFCSEWTDGDGRVQYFYWTGWAEEQDGKIVWCDQDCSFVENVRYWMPIPELPEVEKDG